MLIINHLTMHLPSVSSVACNNNIPRTSVLLALQLFFIQPPTRVDCGNTWGHAKLPNNFFVN